MSNAETTELKLKTTPTGGMDASHSPYYRRLLSAGYKGYLQGSIGGASLYGVIGLAIGAIVAAPLAIVGAAAGGLSLAAASTLALAAGAVGLVKGATTFGDIGSTAAINAESADLSEQRRYLLDRYHDLPEGPEGDREAAEIRKELMARHEANNTPPPFFHWKTMAICAGIGALVALAAFSPIGLSVMAATPMVHVFEAIGLHLTSEGFAAAAGSSFAAFASGGALTALGTAVGAAMGALAGSVVGIDRYYVRKWFDVTEGVVHSTPHSVPPELQERSNLVGRLREAAKADEATKQTLRQQPVSDSTQAAEPAAVAAQPAATIVTPPQLSVAPDMADKPDTKISHATMQDRLVKLQQAMNAAI